MNVTPGAAGKSTQVDEAVAEAVECCDPENHLGEDEGPSDKHIALALFDLARRVRRLEEDFLTKKVHDGRFDQKQLRQIYRRWWTRWLSVGGHPWEDWPRADFDVGFTYFLKMMTKVKLPFGTDPVQAAWQESEKLAACPPADLLSMFERPGKPLIRLGLLCRQLQIVAGLDESGKPVPFYLASRTVSGLLGWGDNPRPGALVLATLVNRHVLAIAKQSTRHRAAEYVYLLSVATGPSPSGKANTVHTVHT